MIVQHWWVYCYSSVSRKLCWKLYDLQVSVMKNQKKILGNLSLCHDWAYGRWLTVWIQVKSFNLFLLFNPSGKLNTSISLGNRWCTKAKFSQIKKEENCVISIKRTKCGKKQLRIKRKRAINWIKTFPL